MPFALPGVPALDYCHQKAALSAPRASVEGVLIGVPGGLNTAR